MKRLSTVVILLTTAIATMGAKGGGCSADYAPGDGSSSAWPTAKVPTPSANVEPMSCAWLDGDNCWKRVVEKAKSCAALATTGGKLASDRSSCSYPSGAEWQFGGALDTPAAGETQIAVSDWRILDSKGEPCITGKILGVGKTLIDAGGEVVLFESPTVTTYHVTCSDGSTYGDDVKGTCDDFSVRWLQHRAPGSLWECHTSDCELSLWGGATGEEEIASCTQ